MVNNALNEGWHHKRNFTVKLAYTQHAQQASQAFPPQDYTAGRISNPSNNRNPRPATTTVGSAAWILCAVNTQGQQRYTYGNFNGWCWDGQSYRDMWNRTTYAGVLNGLAPVQQLSYFACRIDFQGSPGPAKRDQTPLGEFGGQTVYGTLTVIL